MRFIKLHTIYTDDESKEAKDAAIMINMEHVRVYYQDLVDVTRVEFINGDFIEVAETGVEIDKLLWS